MALSVFPTLQCLDEEGRAPDSTPEKNVKIGKAIKKVLDMVEKDFGRLSMMTHVVGCVCKLMDRTLGPLHSDTVEKPEAEGAKLSGITSIIVIGD